VGDVDLVRAVNGEEGPWVMALCQPAVDAMARIVVDDSLLKRWVNAVADFYGRKVAYCREYLTADAAQTLKAMCLLAVEKRLGVFTCFYG
jgi:hypothetical protein